MFVCKLLGHVYRRVNLDHKLTWCCPRCGAWLAVVVSDNGDRILVDVTDIVEAMGGFRKSLEVGIL